MKRNIVDKVVAYFSPEKGFSRDIAKARSNIILSRNAYDAATKGRRDTWTRATNASARAETGAALTTVRARSRDLVRNNPLAHRAVEGIVSNTVGGGIIPAARSGDETKKALANELMNEFINSCDEDGLTNLFGLQSMAMSSTVESGESVTLRKLGVVKGSRIPLQIKVVEGDFIDHTKATNNIVQGVQFSKNKRQGYWLFPDHPGDKGYFQQQSRLTSADQVAHLYLCERPGQVRGMPWGISGFTRLKLLDDFQDARMEQQKVAALLVGAIIDDPMSGTASDVLPEKLEPGMFPKLGPGQDIRFNTPPSVTGHGEFVSIEQHQIAAAYGIPYPVLTGRYEDLNFSSGKMGWAEFARNIERWRWHMLIPQWCKRVESWFFEAAAIAGFDLSGVSFEWTPPRREMIDPTKEIPAQIKAIRAGLKTWSETVRENGYDAEHQAQQIEEDNKRFDDKQIILDTDPRKVSNGGQFQVEASTDDNEQ